MDLVPVSAGGETLYAPRAGGSPYNVAIGLGRLGVPVGFFGRLSDDAFGRQLRDRLSAEGVDNSRLVTGPEPTAIAVVHLAAGAEPHFTFYGDGAADSLLALDDLPAPANLDDSVQALHFGSISLVRQPAAAAYEHLLRRESGRRVISLDPNVRPSVIPNRDAYRARLEALVALAHIVKVSRADLAWLYPDRQPEDTAAAWLARGPALVVMTRGADGAIAMTGRAVIDVPGVHVMVHDTVGAGDAFTAGLLGSLAWRGLLARAALSRLGADDVRASLEFANRAAALTCTQSGAEPPTRVQVRVLEPPPLG